jgi:GT2 family glycosyltransferase
LKQVHEIEALAGAFMLVRRSAGDEVNWWDEDYFFYGEDLDFCYNLKKKGWKIYFVPTYEILHYKGAAGGMKKTSQHVTKATLETKKRAVDARFNAMKIFYNKNYKKKYPSLVTWLVFAGINTKAFITKRTI